ncbi:MAG: hypothetical protein SGPRY_011956 [Prymnesium sp.]
MVLHDISGCVTGNFLRSKEIKDMNKGKVRKEISERKGRQQKPELTSREFVAMSKAVLNVLLLREEAFLRAIDEPLMDKLKGIPQKERHFARTPNIGVFHPDEQRTSVACSYMDALSTNALAVAITQREPTEDSCLFFEKIFTEPRSCCANFGIFHNIWTREHRDEELPASFGEQSVKAGAVQDAARAACVPSQMATRTGLADAFSILQPVIRQQSAFVVVPQQQKESGCVKGVARANADHVHDNTWFTSSTVRELDDFESCAAAIMLDSKEVSVGWVFPAAKLSWQRPQRRSDSVAKRQHLSEHEICSDASPDDGSASDAEYDYNPAQEPDSEDERKMRHGANKRKREPDVSSS